MTIDSNKARVLNKLIFGSLVLNILLAVLFLFVADRYKLADKILKKMGYRLPEITYADNPHYDRRMKLFLASDARAAVVVLGDSLTEQLDWAEWLPGTEALNRGISGDTTEGMLARIHEVLDRNPEIVIIQGGINDLKEGRSFEDVFRRITKMVEVIKAQGSEPVLCSALTVERSFPRSEGINAAVRRLNGALREYCILHNVEWIDLIEEMGAQDFLPGHLSLDGIHLQPEAYSIWVSLLSDHIDKTQER